jgi:hypothetical protein
MATDLVETVSEEYRTELSRLGSSKSLYAATRGEMNPEAVLAAVADMTCHAAESLEGWEESAAAAEREREHYEAIVERVDGHEPGDRPAALAALADSEGTAERLGALIGWTMVAERTASQATGFFTGQADPQTASLFREFGENYEGIREETREMLADHDVETATAAASDVVEAAYQEYVDRLEEMGVNPKPVC